MTDPANAALTVREAALRFRLPPATVGMWVVRGWIDAEGQRRHFTRVNPGETPARHPLAEYALAERDTRLKAGKSHRKLAG